MCIRDRVYSPQTGPQWRSDARHFSLHRGGNAQAPDYHISPWALNKLLRLPLERDDVHTVNLRNPDHDLRRPAGRDIPTHKIRSDGKLSVPAVYQYSQSDCPGQGVVHQRVDRGPDGAARIENIIHQDNNPILQIERYPG